MYKENPPLSRVSVKVCARPVRPFRRPAADRLRRTGDRSMARGLPDRRLRIKMERVRRRISSFGTRSIFRFYLPFAFVFAEGSE